MGKTHLIIPDSHAHPDHSNERYSWLGNLIVDVKPDVVVDIGDWWDMPSLCSYDRGKRSFEGRRYHRDIAAGVEAQDRMFAPIRKQKKKLPRFVRCLGNHEDRINRALDMDPILEGTIGLSDLQSKEYGWEEHAFKDVVEIDGVSYSHFFASGVMGRPVVSARSLVQKKHQSCTQGHIHTFDYFVDSDVRGRTIHGLFAGVYQDYEADYAGQGNALWVPGVAIKRGVENGSYDLEWVSLKRIKEIYGD